jgi:DNA-binding SARP family transcriptional activator/ABC-type branched-subunit amino acid transport system substrate-binding protein/DNA-binding beta-propeller fold protein YncE
VLRFRILGPLEVVERDAPLPLGGAKQRAVLAILLLHRGEAISSERLINELWGERPPATAAKTLQGYVFHLRRALGDGLLHTRRAGYELELAPGQLDADEFERLAAEGRAALSDGDPTAAAGCLRTALALWRGPPLADFAYESFAQAEIARLQEARLAALEDRIDADLALGRQEQLVGELDALVREHPLRERLRGQLMLALYRSGRQVESLAVYRDARETLVHELGLEPGRSLQELEQAILSQDPQLGTSGRRLPRPQAPRRAAVLIGLGGLLLACAAVAAGIVALTAGGGGGHVKALGGGVAAIDPGTGRVASLTETLTAPSNVAVGEGAVWVLNTEDTTISRIDPNSKKVVRRFEIGGVPSDIAAGAGALWVGKGGGPDNNGTVSISRVDPRTNRITRTVRLPDTATGSQWPTVGFPGIAVGAGAVWAINPDQTISRIDPKTGRRVATVNARASTIAAGDAGVWFVDADRSAVTRIDPRTNRVAQTIPVGANVLLGIAVGAESVWATGENEGLVWRIGPGPHPVTRSIDTGAGVSFITFGDGMVWAANDVDGKVSRIDPRTNSVTAKLAIGASQAIAAGDGSVWVSVAGAASSGALPASSCADVVSGGRTPDVLIASDNPLQGPNSGGPRALTDAIRLVLEQHGFRAGKYAVGYQSCDASTAQSNTFEFRKCAANANAYARARRLVAVIGPYNSQCATVEMPILNRAPGGPLAEISPSNSYPGLTRPVSLPAKWGGLRNEPNTFYPTGVRHYVRLAANDDFEGVADAILAKRLGLTSAYLLDDGQGAEDVWITNSFRRTARRLDIRIAGAERYDPAAKSYDALAEKIARSGAQGVVIGGDVSQGGDRLLKALRAHLAPRTTIMTGEIGFTPVSEVLKRAGRAALGLYVSSVNIPGAARDLTPAARQFLRDLGTTEPLPWVLEAGQAAELVLQAIARSDGTRASVLKELRAAEVKNGLLGSFHFNRNGDITPATVMIVRITGSTPPGSGLDSTLQGAARDSIVKIPASLTG